MSVWSQWEGGRGKGRQINPVHRVWSQVGREGKVAKGKGWDFFSSLLEYDGSWEEPSTRVGPRTILPLYE